MPLLTPQNVILALLLIAPGFIAVFVAITIGVIEREISIGRIIIMSIVSSTIVDSLFLTIAQALGETVDSTSAFEEIIFHDGFQPLYVALLFVLSIVLGIVYSLWIILDLQSMIRDWFWNLSDRKRFPWQPWEGLMRDSVALQVTTAEGEQVRGFLHEYSRAERPRQLRLAAPEWWGPEGWTKAGESDVLLLEDDIDRISVLTLDTNRSEGDSDEQNEEPSPKSEKD